MSQFDRSLQLAKGVIPGVAFCVFVIVRVGPQAGFMIVPFIAVAAIGIVQAVRRSGFIGERKLRGRVSDTASLGRRRADEILSQGD